MLSYVYFLYRLVLMVVEAFLCMWTYFLRFGFVLYYRCNILLVLGGYSCVDFKMQAIDIKLQNGYGLTETSPVVACRRLACNVSKIASRVFIDFFLKMFS